MVHKLFDHCRVVKPALADGKTEWFLITFPELRDGIMKIKSTMIKLHGDCGLEEKYKNFPSCK